MPMKNNSIKKVVSFFLAIVLLFQLTACGFKTTVQTAADKVSTGFVTAKDVVVSWCSNINGERFKAGWDSAVAFMGNTYSAVVTSEYVATVQAEIEALGTSINSAYGSARTTAQEAGFAVERWAAGTFNIDAAARGSSNRADVVGSTELGSVDIATNYGEDYSSKFYATAKGSAAAQARLSEQAKQLFNQYADYNYNNPGELTLAEFMDKKGYDPITQDELLSSLYSGQLRIIPANQLDEAVEYLKGRIDRLTAVDGDIASANTKVYQETLKSLRDRLKAPDGTTSKPVSYEEMQAIADLSKKGEFKPEDFGISLSTAIKPTYVLKQAMGTGVEAGIIRAALTTAPDIISIIKQAISNGELDQDALEETGIKGAIAGSEGFVEGAVTSTLVTLAKAGKLGASMSNASPVMIAQFTFIVMEALFDSYSLAKGEITPEEYGCLMADKITISLTATAVSSLTLMALPGSKIALIVGSMAGAMLAAGVMNNVKQYSFEMIDGGGFEAVVPEAVASKFNVVKDYFAGIDIEETLSDMKDFAVSTSYEGIIFVKSIFTHS